MSFADDLGDKLHGLWAFVTSVTEHMNMKKTYVRYEMQADVRRFDVKDSSDAFQLESLILAQNERWRQA